MWQELKSWDWETCFLLRPTGQGRFGVQAGGNDFSFCLTGQGGSVQHEETHSCARTFTLWLDLTGQEHLINARMHAAIGNSSVNTNWKPEGIKFSARRERTSLGVRNATPSCLSLTSKELASKGAPIVDENGLLVQGQCSCAVRDSHGEEPCELTLYALLRNQQEYLMLQSEPVTLQDKVRHQA